MKLRTLAAFAALSKAEESKEYDSDRYPVSPELPVSKGAAAGTPSSLAVPPSSPPNTGTCGASPIAPLLLSPNNHDIVFDLKRRLHLQKLCHALEFHFIFVYWIKYFLYIFLRFLKFTNVLVAYEGDKQVILYLYPKRYSNK